VGGRTVVGAAAQRGGDTVQRVRRLRVRGAAPQGPPGVLLGLGFRVFWFWGLEPAARVYPTRVKAGTGRRFTQDTRGSQCDE